MQNLGVLYVVTCSEKNELCVINIILTRMMLYLCDVILDGLYNDHDF